MKLLFEFLLITFHVFLTSRIIPLLLSKNNTKKSVSYVRIGEESTILIYAISAVVYLFGFFLEFDFILNADIGIDTEEAYTEEIKALEPFILWNFWYFAMLLCVSFFSPRKEGDFYELMIHHIATMALIWAAFSASWLTASVWVLLINMIFDIFLSLSRIAYKMDHWLQVPFFGIAVIIHFILRVFLFPYKVITAVLYSERCTPPAFSDASVLLVIPLWLLFVYWGYCMINVCYLRLWKKEYRVDYTVGEKSKTISVEIEKNE